MKPLIYIAAILILITGFISCDRIKNKTAKLSEKVKKKTKEGIKEQTRKIIDKVFKPFDYDKPDTENNKKRFIDFLKVKISSDVKNIYCFDDAIGIDADYMFAFNCDLKTSEKIIKFHNLTIDTLNSDNGFEIQRDFEWWNKKQIEKLKKYSWTNDGQYFKYYWYDKGHQKAYFFDFNL